MMTLGAQFFTLREHCQTLDDLALSLRKVADMGYTTVQISGTCPYEADWMKQELDRNGLTCALTHIPIPELTEHTGETIAKHHAIGCERIGLGYYPFDNSNPDTSFDHFIEVYADVARKIREGGRYFMYHNHDQEFRRMDGQLILERLAERIPAEDMGFTLDTFWVQAGGGDPAQWLEKLAGRIPCIHLKDYAYGRKMAVVGEGNLNWDRILKKAEASGTRYLLVEQDDCYGEDPFDCLRRSYEYLKAQGLK